MLALKNALKRQGLLSAFGVALLTTLSCATAPSPFDSSGSRPTCPTRVFCLRGLWDLFSWGLNDLSAELQADGVHAITMSGPNWPDLADYLIKTYAGADSIPELVLIGHSYGVDAAVNVALALREHDIPVRLLVSIDGTSPAPIPPNVQNCIHLYFETIGGGAIPSELPGHPIALEAGNTTTDLRNIVITAEQFGPEVVGANHMDVDTNPAIHRYIIDQVLPLCISAGPQREFIPTAAR